MRMSAARSQPAKPANGVALGFSPSSSGKRREISACPQVGVDMITFGMASDVQVKETWWRCRSYEAYC